ncbi:MAG: glycoside hydrolase family 5 protein [Verrucomicrobia bacterium]|nr:glycoside hydrolase family 5 protein [Verrucomicrobiota bacterium]
MAGEPDLLQAIQVSGGTASVFWDGYLGARYSVEYAASLTGTWSSLTPQTNLAGQPETMSAPDAVTSGRFYRLQTDDPGLPFGVDKWALWTNGTRLRGANVYQRRVYPDLDGEEFYGPGPLGPPHTQDDFNRLADLRANYVNISHPGLYTESPPYALDTNVQNGLDAMIDKAARAGLFAVISFRTGPGRSEFAILRDGAGDWFPSNMINDAVWTNAAAQDGWVTMWQYTAARYRDQPVVVGYDLMVEPNADDAYFQSWDPDWFYSQYSNTLYDWNQLHPRIATAIREVDSNTPILVGGEGYSAVDWMPYLRPSTNPLVVYTAHNYEPFVYTHQDTNETSPYPGYYDIDYDGSPENFNKGWLSNLLHTVYAFGTNHHVPVAVNEYGVVRYARGAPAFLDDELDLFERYGFNHALWVWAAAWPPQAEEDSFDCGHGTNAAVHTDSPSNALIRVLTNYWGRNEAP